MNPNKRLRLAREKQQAAFNAFKAARYQQAADYSLEATELWKGLKGEEQNCVKCLVNAANAFYKLGNEAFEATRYQQATDYSLKAAELCKGLKGGEKNYARCLVNAANALDKLSRYTEAKNLLEKALIVQKQTLGNEAPEMATSFFNLANVYQKQGNYEQAKQLYEEALAVDEKTLGSEHPKVASDWNNLANIYEEQGEYERAKQLHEKALAIRKKTLGSEHPDVAASLNNLATVYEAQGEIEKAKDYYQRAQTIINKVFDENHPTAQMISRNYLKLQQEVEHLRRREIEQQIALEEAKTLNSLGNLVAHNINNPVGIIRLAAQRGLRKIEKGMRVAEGQEIFQRILKQADHLHTIIQKFRNFITNSDRKQREVVELNALVKQIKDDFESQLEVHNITLTLELSDQNPCSQANHLALQEALMNLLNNACEALEDIPDAFILIKTWQNAKKVGLQVEDNGAGIPQEQQKDLFFPLHSTKAHGTGLGLHLTRIALADIGGTITYQDRQPNGACFIIELPPTTGEKI